MAVDVPQMLRALLSNNPDIRENAVWGLTSNIYHHGDLFESTAYAIPFLVELFVSEQTPDRAQVGEVLLEISESAQRDDQHIRRRWQKEYERWAHLHEEPEHVKAERDLQAVRSTRRAILSCRDQLRRVFSHPPEGLGKLCDRLSEQVEALSVVEQGG